MGDLPVADDELIRALYRDHGDFLLGYVQRLVGGDRARAEDVVQETLLRAWQHPEAFTRGENTSVRGWLVTVARRVVIDGERARAARPREVPHDERPDAPSVQDHTDAVLLAQEMAEVMQSLTPAHRDVVVAMYGQQLSVAEAAAVLGVPEGTVKSRAYYALRAMRAACEERGLTW